MLHDERAKVASGEVLSNIVALIPRYGVSALLSELSEDWRRALVTWLVEAYDNTCPIEDFEGIHNPGAREQIQGARAWMAADSSYRDYIVNDVTTLLAMTKDRLYSRHDLMRQLVRISAQRGLDSLIRELPDPWNQKFIAWARNHFLDDEDGDAALYRAGVREVRDWLQKHAI